MSYLKKFFIFWKEGPIVEVIEVDKQLLLDKIVRLQKAQARRQEKIDFLEEHVTQLLSEVKKKSRYFVHVLCFTIKLSCRNC